MKSEEWYIVGLHLSKAVQSLDSGQIRLLLWKFSCLGNSDAVSLILFGLVASTEQYLLCTASFLLFTNNLSWMELLSYWICKQIYNLYGFELHILWISDWLTSYLVHMYVSHSACIKFENQSTQSLKTWLTEWYVQHHKYHTSMFMFLTLKHIKWDMYGFRTT